MSTTEDQTPVENTRTVYEIGYLVLPSIPEDSLDVLVSKINNVFEKAGGTRIDGEAPFMQDLAYEMSKQVGARNYIVQEAYLGWVKFDLPTQEDLEQHPIETVKADLEKIEELLRFLLVKVPRETVFTFAAARQALQDAEDAKNAPVAEPEAPAVVAPETLAPVVE